jgi:Kef-type K+ transport system membrane component KefB
MSETHSFADLLLALIATILATKLLGELAQRVGQPSVLGELVAGLLLGGSLLGLLDPNDPVIAAFMEIGVLVLLFEIGLHTDVKSLVRVGRSASLVGLVGVAVPFAAGYLVTALLGESTVTAVVAGASLTATSIGISARVLSDLGQLQRPEGQIVLGAAVLDDVVGLIILSVVSGLAAGAGVTLAGIGITTAVAVGFIVAAFAVGSVLIPPTFKLVQRLQTSGALGLIALAFAFLMAWLADVAHSAMIIGAFAAGLVLHRTEQRHDIEIAVTPIGFFFVPIFFAGVGAAVDLRSLADTRALAIGAALIAIGIVGKFVAGYAAIGFRGNKALIGVAMIPRGEVGLIFAQMGLATGALDVQLFSAITLMVMVTTFMTPPVLNVIVARGRRGPPTETRGDGGIDDLVAGSWHPASGEPQGMSPGELGRGEVAAASATRDPPGTGRDSA